MTKMLPRKLSVQELATQPENKNTSTIDANNFHHHSPT